LKKSSSATTALCVHGLRQIRLFAGLDNTTQSILLERTRFGKEQNTCDQVEADMKSHLIDGRSGDGVSAFRTDLAVRPCRVHAQRLRFSAKAAGKNIFPGIFLGGTVRNCQHLLSVSRLVTWMVNDSDWATTMPQFSKSELVGNTGNWGTEILFGAETNRLCVRFLALKRGVAPRLGEPSSIDRNRLREATKFAELHLVKEQVHYTLGKVLCPMPPHATPCTV